MKAHIYISKRLYCKVMLVFITEFLVVGHGGASNSGKITSRSAIFPGIFVSKSEFICKKHSLYTLIVVQVHIYRYISDNSMQSF